MVVQRHLATLVVKSARLQVLVAYSAIHVQLRLSSPIAGAATAEQNSTTRYITIDDDNEDDALFKYIGKSPISMNEFFFIYSNFICCNSKFCSCSSRP